MKLIVVFRLNVFSTYLIPECSGFRFSLPTAKSLGHADSSQALRIPILSIDLAEGEDYKQHVEAAMLALAARFDSTLFDSLIKRYGGTRMYRLFDFTRSTDYHHILRHLKCQS